MILCVLLLFAPETHSQGFVGQVRKFTISGNVGLPGVTMQGLPGAPQTDENGVYSAQVDYNWSGTVTPVKLGYTFEPNHRAYQNVKEDKTDGHYQANALTFTISGTTGQPSVQLVGLPDDPISDPNGRFRVTVNYGWSATVTPTKEGYRFDPPSAVLDQVKENKSINFRATQLTFAISGSVGPEGVVMQGLPGNPTTDRDGNYRVEVPYNWSGTVTPTKEGYTFNPPSNEYVQVVGPRTDNYSAEVFTYQISGTTGLVGVTMDGLPGPPVTDENGYYTATVPYAWQGKVTPSRAGYTFTPDHRQYPKVTNDQLTENYNAAIIKLKISGNVRQAGVTMDGLPGVVSDATGNYSAEVDWGWAGTVTPMKDGYTFTPPSQVYPSLASDQLSQNYTPKAVTFTIAGNVGLPGVRLEGLTTRGQTVVSGANGSYSAEVPYKWSGTVTPRLAGYTFEPESKTYTEVLADAPTDDYVERINQYMVTGRILDDRGQPVANVPVYAADTVSGSAMTDSDGSFELLVNHGWQGTLTPQMAGYTFEPKDRSLGPLLQSTSNIVFAAKVQMVSITDSVVVGSQPIQDVLITAQPGNYTAKTDAKGKFTVKVPYGWSGELTAQKEGFDFPGTIPYTNVTEDIDKTQAARPVTPPVGTTARPPVTPPSQPVTPPSQPVTQPSQPVAQPSTPTTQDPEKQALIDMLKRYEEQLRMLQGQPQQPGPNETTPMVGPEPVVARRVGGPPVSGRFVRQDLVAVLTQLSEQANVPIARDRTVKKGATTVNVELPAGTPLEFALETVLQGEYAFEKEGDAYLVYRPITTTFAGEDLRADVLPLLSSMAGVTIAVPDETVQGQVFAELDGVPLNTALDTVLAGTGYAAVEKENYYLVGSREILEPEGTAIRYSPAFPDITETRMVYMNWVTPVRAKELMSGAFNRYIMADPDPNSHIVTVTAPPDLVKRIVADLKQIDLRPRQVLLDARVVVMERGDLLDIGIEYGFPQIRAGAFKDSFLVGDRAAGNLTASWPWGVQIGYSPDRTFTNSLLMALNLLEQNGQADIVTNPQVLADDGKMSEVRYVIEDNYVLTGPESQNFWVQSEFLTVTSGTTLSITPRIMDNNDISLELAVEVSESVPRGQGTDLPRVTRRTTRSNTTVSDGGTVALAGLTETRSKVTERRVPGLSNLPLIGGLFRNTDSEQSTKEIAVFVTAQLVHDSYRAPTAPTTTMDQRMPTAPAADTYREQLMRSLATQGGY